MTDETSTEVPTEVTYVQHFNKAALKRLGANPSREDIEREDAKRCRKITAAKEKRARKAAKRVYSKPVGEVDGDS